MESKTKTHGQWAQCSCKQPAWDISALWTCWTQTTATKKKKNAVNSIHARRASIKNIQSDYSASNHQWHTRDRGEECVHRQRRWDLGRFANVYRRGASERGRTAEKKKCTCQTTAAAWDTSGAFTPADTSRGELKTARVSKYWENTWELCSLTGAIHLPERVCF